MFLRQSGVRIGHGIIRGRAVPLPRSRTPPTPWLRQPHSSALWLTRYVSSLLFGVVHLDPTTLVGVAVLIFSLALVATYLPARRAMGVDPIVALRHE